MQTINPFKPASFMTTQSLKSYRSSMNTQSIQPLPEATKDIFFGMEAASGSDGENSRPKKRQKLFNKKLDAETESVASSNFSLTTRLKRRMLKALPLHPTTTAKDIMNAYQEEKGIAIADSNGKINQAVGNAKSNAKRTAKKYKQKTGTSDLASAFHIKPHPTREGVHVARYEDGNRNVRLIHKGTIYKGKDNETEQVLYDIELASDSEKEVQ